MLWNRQQRPIARPLITCFTLLYHQTVALILFQSRFLFRQLLNIVNVLVALNVCETLGKHRVGE